MQHITDKYQIEEAFSHDVEVPVMSMFACKEDYERALARFLEVHGDIDENDNSDGVE